MAKQPQIANKGYPFTAARVNECLGLKGLRDYDADNRVMAISDLEGTIKFEKKVQFEKKKN